MKKEDDPVYSKLEFFFPELFINKEHPDSRFWTRQVRVGIKHHLDNFYFFKKNFSEMYDKLLVAQGTEIIEALLNPKYIPSFDYGVLKKF
jgi:hypothetical protein